MKGAVVGSPPIEMWVAEFENGMGKEWEMAEGHGSELGFLITRVEHFLDWRSSTRVLLGF